MTAESPGRRLRILICLLYYLPHRTGLTRHVQLLAEELARRGHAVTVLTARFDPNLPAESVSPAGVRIVRLWAPVRISRGMVMPGYAAAARREIRRHDVVSVHTPMLEAALVSRLARAAGVEVVATHHGDLVLPSGGFNRFVAAVMLRLFATMARRASRLVAYSDDYLASSTYLREHRPKVTVIAPPVAIPEPRSARAETLRATWRTGGGPLIGYAGRFVREKRPDLLIRALEVLDRHRPSARVVFAGEYDIRYEGTWAAHRELVERHRERLIFLGLVTDRQELADFYAACDLLALPSDTECFGLVQVEAMLCGTPVVATDIPGARVPVRRTGMGRLARAGEAESIGAEIAELLARRDEHLRPRSEIEAAFSLSTTIDAYEELLRRHARAR